MYINVFGRLRGVWFEYYFLSLELYLFFVPEIEYPSSAKTHVEDGEFKGFMEVLCG